MLPPTKVHWPRQGEPWPSSDVELIDYIHPSTVRYDNALHNMEPFFRSFLWELLRIPTIFLNAIGSSVGSHLV